MKLRYLYPKHGCWCRRLLVPMRSPCTFYRILRGTPSRGWETPGDETLSKQFRPSSWPSPELVRPRSRSPALAFSPLFAGRAPRRPPCLLPCAPCRDRAPPPREATPTFALSRGSCGDGSALAAREFFAMLLLRDELVKSVISACGRASFDCSPSLVVFNPSSAPSVLLSPVPTFPIACHGRASAGPSRSFQYRLWF